MAKVKQALGQKILIFNRMLVEKINIPNNLQSVFFSIGNMLFECF